MVTYNKNIHGISQFLENTNPVKQKTTIEKSNEFQEILKDKMSNVQDLKFSKHAEQRINSRDMNLSPEQKTRISQGVRKADEKGIRDSLIMMDNMSFIVNVKSRTVITALKNDEANVFTNIDGAVFV